jgi:hypothetical protein
MPRQSRCCGDLFGGAERPKRAAAEGPLLTGGEINQRRAMACAPLPPEVFRNTVYINDKLSEPEDNYTPAIDPDGISTSEIRREVGSRVFPKISRPERQNAFYLCTFNKPYARPCRRDRFRKITRTPIHQQKPGKRIITHDDQNKINTKARISLNKHSHIMHQSSKHQ